MTEQCHDPWCFGRQVLPVDPHGHEVDHREGRYYPMIVPLPGDPLLPGGATRLL